MIFSLSSVIIPFPACERKDQNNRTEIYGSPGAKLLCWSKRKTRAEVVGTLQNLEFHTPRGPAHGHGHGSLLKLTVRRPSEKCRTLRSAFMSHRGNRLNNGSTVMKYSASTCNFVCALPREER